VLDLHHPGARPSLARDAWNELAAWDEVQIRLVPDSQTNERCSVAGGYIYDTSPPTLTVTESASRGRRIFTVIHELGHHLQQNDLDLAVAVRTQPGDAAAFEDAACDAFAARVVITNEHLEAVLTDRSPTAETLLRLLADTQASRSACCARVIEYLGTTGVVAVVDRAGAVLFARAHGDIAPPARGSDQSATPLIRAALASPSGARRDQTHFAYRTGNRTPDLYGDAAWAGDYLMVVAVLDRPGWKAFALPREVPQRFSPKLDGWCDICSEAFPATNRCRVCGQGRCPAGHCPCTAERERTCDTCWLKKHQSQFPSTTATTCNECLR
jgi:hypothetical protein